MLHTYYTEEAPASYVLHCMAEEAEVPSPPEQVRVGRSESAAFLEDYFTTLFDAGDGAVLEGEQAPLNEDG